MRQAINNLQSVVAAFDIVSEESVQSMVDSPHPTQCKDLLEHCSKGNLEAALDILRALWMKGYAPLDIITTLFRVAKSATFLGDQLQLEFIKVRSFNVSLSLSTPQERL